MPIVAHLQELRARLLIVVAAIVAGAVVGWWGQALLIDLFSTQVERLAFFTPAELFVTKVRMAVSIGLVIALPVFLMQAWLFVVPGLYPHEARLLRRAVPAAFGLFVSGLLFGYALVYPVAVQALLGVGGGRLQPAVSIAEHFELFMAMTVPFGLAFQIPLVVPILARLGLVSPLVLRRRRRHVIFWSFVVAAVITPPDALSQVLLALPTILLFEIALRLARRAIGDRG